MKPALSTAMSRVARGLYVSLAASLLAYLCWGYVEGRIPELSELVPGYMDEVPRDPFSGGPLRLASGEEGFTVYSVGRDSRDDGGRTDGTQGPYSPDVGVTVRLAR